MNSSFADLSKQAFTYANITWNNVPGGPIFIARSSTDNSTTNFNQNFENEVFKQNAGTSVGLMTIRTYSINNRVFEFDIRVNTSHPWRNDGGSNGYDVQNAATHEIGHALFSGDVTGSSDVQSQYASEYTEVTMYQYAAMGETKKRTLHQDDKDGFAASN